MPQYKLYGNDDGTAFIACDDAQAISLFGAYVETYNPKEHLWIESSDGSGRIIAGKRPAGAIDLTPTWTGILPLLLAAFENGTPAARIMAMEELQRMATIADRAGQQLQIDDNGKFSRI